MIQKRALILTLCAILLFCALTAGCSGPAASPTSTPTPTPTPTPTSTPTPTPTPIPASLTVQFLYRPDCPYCQALEPQITTLEATYAGRVTVQRIVSDGQVPTLILLNHGVQVGSWFNPPNTAEISAQIDNLLASG